MKVPQWFIPKKRVLKAAQKRLNETMQYVNIDSGIKEREKEVLNKYRESLARFSKRHEIAVNFRKDASDTTKIDVYKTSLSQLAASRRNQGLWYFTTPKYRGTAELKQTGSADFYDNLKNTIKNIAETERETNTKIRFPKKIRHENEYFNWGT